MPITIRKDTERFRLSLASDAGVYYRRLSQKQQHAFIRRATDRNGVCDWAQVAENTVRACVVDWYGFVDEHGETVPFNIELLLDLPPDTVTRIITAISATDAAEVGAEKN